MKLVRHGGSVVVFVLVSVALFLEGCPPINGRFSAVQQQWPATPENHGRLVLFGSDFGWYGVLAGGAWTPPILVDGSPIKHVNATNIYLFVDLGADRHTIVVPESDALTVEIASGEVTFVFMQLYTVPNTSLTTLRQFDYKMRLSRVDSRNAIAILDRCRPISATLAGGN